MAEVDTGLHAHASGVAAKTVAAHAQEHPLKLYAGWFCPFVQRSWMVLEEKNIPYQYVEINPYKKAKEFLDLNPRGLVPTLAVPVDGVGKAQKPLYESSVICDYLNEEFADEATNGLGLYPSSTYQKARCKLWIDHISTKIVPGFYKFIQHTPEKEYSVEEARSNLSEHIKTLAKEMDDSGPWFLGDRFSMVDVMLAPWAKRLFLIDHYKPGGVNIPADKEGGDEALWGRWTEWYNAISERQSVKDTWSEEEYYIKAYQRYAEDRTMSQVGQATRKGERLP
ncbi:glutathione S-transferase [Truncatella angustata]|uniref:Glutathione S-transferase n=1 Tax=Truncatella angustata TaxID=152316 RepID=A0A9P8UUN0_9PEZI|nr:glutathione S-transferase [Truncatella angustata]KAH6658538.1 glutathione S-transferase [Truncatella angustata]